MVDKFKIDGINQTKETENVKATEDVSSVDGVDGVNSVNSVAGVSQVGGVGSVRMKKQTRVLTPAERNEIFKMISQEATDLFGKDSKQGNIAKRAVEMAIDSAIIDKEDK